MDKEVQRKFTGIYETGHWQSHQKESVSGPGSTLNQTIALREGLQKLLAEYEIKSMLDIPCGDVNWVKQLDLKGVHYCGADIVEEIIISNTQQYAGDKFAFMHLDIITDDLPYADLVMTRDCLVHLTFSQIKQAIVNVCRSGSKYLLMTTFDFSGRVNTDIQTGNWRPLNMCNTPFCLPPPACTIDEKCTEGGGKYGDKSMSMWSIDALKARIGYVNKQKLYDDVRRPLLTPPLQS